MIYLASPYRHPDSSVVNWRIHTTAAIAMRLIQIGHPVFCPIPFGVFCQQTTGKELLASTWQTWDDMILMNCQELWVLCLGGWERSEGIQHELEMWKNMSREPPSMIYTLADGSLLCVQSNIVRWHITTEENPSESRDSGGGVPDTGGNG